jgi:hypothetical protein
MLTLWVLFSLAFPCLIYVAKKRQWKNKLKNKRKLLEQRVDNLLIPGELYRYTGIGNLQKYTIATMFVGRTSSENFLFPRQDSTISIKMVLTFLINNKLITYSLYDDNDKLPFERIENRRN